MIGNYIKPPKKIRETGSIARIEASLFVPRKLCLFGAVLLLAYASKFLLHIANDSWLFDKDGTRRFLDFIQFWTAARFALSHAAASAYDSTTFAAAQAPYVALTRGTLPYYHLLYPPTLFPLLAPLGRMPYLPAFITWMTVTGALYLVAIYKIVPSWLSVLLALLPAPVVQNLWLGQMGFLVAGLLGFSLYFMATRPFLSGLILGLLTCKPQYGIIFPIVLLLTRQWRVIAGAIVGFAVLAGAATFFYGAGIWAAYANTFWGLRAGSFMLGKSLIATDQTAFGVMLWLGAAVPLRWLVHLAVAIPAIALVYIICARPGPAPLKAAAMAIGALVATPYMLMYDLTALSVPAAFLVQDGLATGFLPGERVTLLACYFMLFVSKQFPVGPFILALMMLLLVRRLDMVRGRVGALTEPDTVARPTV